MPIIDAHVHYWQVARGDYGWMTPDLPICRDFLPSDAAPLFDDAGIDGIVLVQAAPTEAETHFLLSLAHIDPRVRGVVGWTDMATPDAPARIAAVASNPLLRGIRPMLQDIAEDDWLLRPELNPAYRAIIEHDLSFDALVRVRHLKLLPRLLDRHPDLRVVIDHAAKPDIAAAGFDEWHADMAALAQYRDLHCKLSGLLTEAKPGASLADIAPYAQAVLDLFGPHRIIWGSDWPVLTLNGSYAQWWDWAHELTAALSDEERAAIFGGNATRFYKLRP